MAYIYKYGTLLDYLNDTGNESRKKGNILCKYFLLDLIVINATGYGEKCYFLPKYALKNALYNPSISSLPCIIHM